MISVRFKLICKKGIHSIDVYALQRKDLVDDREILIKKIQAQIVSVNRCVDQQNKIGKGINAETDKWLNDEVNNLKTFLAPNEPYLAVARQYIGPFMLKKFGIKI